MNLEPSISVIVATWRRPATLPKCIASILANTRDSFEVLVANQNPPGETESQLGALLQDPRLRLLNVPPRGASLAQNAAAKSSRGGILLFTDDDCEAPPDWIAQCEAAFARHQAAGVLIGAVDAGPHDASAGFIPCVARGAERLWLRVHDKPEIEVLGACMAVRRQCWNLLGGFPPGIAPGAPINAGGDYDLALRALLCDIPVLETANVRVTHHGFRAWKEAQRLLEGYAYGTALVLALRTARRPRLFFHCLLAYWRSYRKDRSSVVAAARGRWTRPPRRVIFFTAGLLRGAVLAISGQEPSPPA
jgi:glycosyltransferase involved in cell wall biosynthesis